MGKRLLSTLQEMEKYQTCHSNIDSPTVEGSRSWCLMLLSISWQSVLLLEETGVPGENHRPVTSHRQALSHNVVSSTPRLSRVQTHNVSGNRH